jgi:hypothetical protein
MLHSVCPSLANSSKAARHRYRFDNNGVSYRTNHIAAMVTITKIATIIAMDMVYRCVLSRIPTMIAEFDPRFSGGGAKAGGHVELAASAFPSPHPPARPIFWPDREGIMPQPAPHLARAHATY